MTKNDFIDEMDNAISYLRDSWETIEHMHINERMKYDSFCCNVIPRYTILDFEEFFAPIDFDRTVPWFNSNSLDEQYDRFNLLCLFKEFILTEELYKGY